MSKPYLHAQSSAKKFGGTPEDYIEIHNFMDSSKGAIADNRHRALTHNAWFLVTVLERIKFSNSHVTDIRQSVFSTIVNSDGKHVSVRDVGEQHILEDFKNKFIPSAQDYLSEIEFQPWMNNAQGLPPSFANIGRKKVRPEDTVIDGSRILPTPVPDFPWPGFPCPTKPFPDEPMMPTIKD